MNEFEEFEAGFSTTPDNDHIVIQILKKYRFKYSLKFTYNIFTDDDVLI